MGDSLNQSVSEVDRSVYIFIGKYISPSEIHIYNNPTFHDALQLSRKPAFIQEHSYQYLHLRPNEKIRFYYFDGHQKKRGIITLAKDGLQIKMKHELNPFYNYFLIQRGRELSFIDFSPNNKIKKRKKDILIVQSEMRTYGRD
jgi:hypothetical protein